jgi:hypothetical protein
MTRKLVFVLLLSVVGCCYNRPMETPIPIRVEVNTTRPSYNQRTPDWPQQELRPCQPPYLLPCPDRVRRLPPVA